ncbi:MAG: hypothetical protein M3Q10_03280, partial [Chloroflexota bacterium]|nr:hypothetical protein [Chloroflexota bacterium]
MSRRIDRREPFGYSGPRDMIPRDTPEWAWRTIQRLKSVWSQVSSDERQAAEVIEEIEQSEAYKRWPQDRPYGSLDALLRGEIGKSLAEVRQRIADTARARSLAAAAATTGEVLETGKVNQHTVV